MDHDIPCIFDDIDANDNDALSRFLNDLEDEPAPGDASTNDDDFQSILNGTDQPDPFTSQTAGDGVGASPAFRSPQPPTPAQHVPQPSTRTTPVQQNMVTGLSPRTLQQPTTPGSVVNSPYSQHQPTTPSPVSRQLTTPSPMGSPMPNSFQQPQKQLDVKTQASNATPVQNCQPKVQVQVPSVQDYQMQIINQQQLLKSQPASTACSSQPVTQTVTGQQANTTNSQIHVQLQGSRVIAGQNVQQIGSARIQTQQVQGTVIQTSLGNQVIFPSGLHGQVQLHPQVGTNQLNQLVTSHGNVIQSTQPMVTIAASNIQPPSLQAPPNISIMNLQNQIQPQQQQQQQLVLQQGTSDSQQHNVILTTLPGSNVMQLTATAAQQNAIPAGVVLGQNQTQVLLAKGGQKVQGQVLLQSQPVATSQIQIAGLKPANLTPNTVTIQNPQGQIINLQPPPAQQNTIMQAQQRQLVQVNSVNGQTLTLTTQQLQQLINLQQKKQVIQQPTVQQQQASLQGQSQVQVLQTAGTGGLQVITTSSSASGIIPKPVSSTISQPTLATQAAVQQNLQEIRDKMLKQSAQQQSSVGDLTGISQSSAVSTVRSVANMAGASSQAVVGTQAAVGTLTQAGTLTVLGAAGQPQASRHVSVVGPGQVLTQAIVQHPPQAGVLQLQPNTISSIPSQAAVVSKTGLVTVQAIAVQNVGQQAQPVSQAKQQVTQFRQILPSTSQLLSTATSTSTATTTTNAMSNFASLLPSATSKPNVVAPNVNIQTLGLGNQVNSLVLQQQLQQQQKERQLQQQKAAPRLLPGQPPNNTNVPSGQINASLALQQLNVAQQQRNAGASQDVKPASEQQQHQLQVNGLPQVINPVSTSQPLITSSSLLSDPLNNSTLTISSPLVTSPLISTTTSSTQGLVSATVQKTTTTPDLLNGSTLGAGLTQVASNTSGLLNVVTTATPVSSVCLTSQSATMTNLQRPVLATVPSVQPIQGQGQVATATRLPAIQLSPQLQQALATVQQKMRMLLAIQNRTAAQNTSLQQLMLWQQKILIIARSQALKSQQGAQQQQQQTTQQPSGLVQGTVTAAVLPTQLQASTTQQSHLIVHKPVSVAQQVAVTSGSTGIPVQVQELLTSAASTGSGLMTTFATTTIVSPAAPNTSADGSKLSTGTSNQDTKVITNINQLPPEMKEKLRLQLAKLSPAQLDYFLKNQTYVLTQLIRQQQEMQKQRQQQTTQISTAPGVKPVTEQVQKPVIQQVASGNITIVAASTAVATTAVSGTATAAVIPAIPPSSTPSVATPVKLPMKMNRKQLLGHYITKDQKKVEQPDYKEPFQNHKDILKRLLAYHVCQVKQDKRVHIEEGAAAYEEVAQELLAKKDEMFKKYQYLILEESMRQDRTAEMVMLERMFLTSERELLAEEKKKAEEDPENFVPVPCLSVSSDEEDSVDGNQGSNSSVESPVTPPAGDTSLDSMNTSNIKHSTDNMMDEQHSPGGNYTLRASTGLRLVFKTSPLHTSVSSPAPLTENFSVKSEDSGISSQQNSVETDEDGAPPRKKMCVSTSEEKEHYRTSNNIKPSASGQVAEKSVIKDEQNLPFDTYAEESVKKVEEKVPSQDGEGDQLNSAFSSSVGGLDGLGASEADSAVAGLLSSSDMLSQDLGAYSEDLFGELTLEQHLSQGLPNNFMAEPNKETCSKPQQEYYSEISDYDTDTNTADKERDMELQDAIGGLLSDMETDRDADGDKMPFLDQPTDFLNKPAGEAENSDDVGTDGKSFEESACSDDVKCSDETRSAINSLLALESPSSFSYL